MPTCVPLLAYPLGGRDIALVVSALYLLKEIVRLVGESIAVAVIAFLSLVVALDDAVTSTLYGARYIVGEDLAVTTVREVSCSSSCSSPEE